MHKRLIVAALAATALVVVTGSALAAASQSAVIFDSTVKTGPKSNVPSYGPEAYSTAQVGGEASFAAGSKRKLSSVAVTLSSWACVSGHWTGGDCATPAGAKYSLPITLNIYDTSGQFLTSKTQTFDLSYRPSANPAKCPTAPGKWWSTTEKTCFNGLAQDVTFTFDGTTTLPDTVRYAITYDTSHNGSNPKGDQPCTSTMAGCFYDSLNVSSTDAGPSVGTGKGTRFFDATGNSSIADPDYTPAVQFKAA